ncbi:hypothetical protein VTO42DRAFT_2800 [Malbranchea cinnamomea]
MSPIPDPLVRSRSDGLQLSYQLPHRVYDAKVYPVKAPNDSTVIIYGHELGIKVLWRGGRKFNPKQSPPTPAEPVSTREQDDVIIISDTEDEAPPPAPAPETSDEPDQYEDEDEELDPDRPFPKILRSVDIPLGSKVLSLAVPNASPEAAPSPRDSCPSVLSNTIVVAAVCSDASTRVVALPIAPPADEDSANFQTLKIGEGSIHSIPARVAITFTSSNYQIRTKSHSRTKQGDSPAKRLESWEILLAVQTNEAIGTLLIYRIPLIRQERNVYVFSQDSISPFQREFLPSPANTISFSPSQYPSDYHSWLLVSFLSGHVKIYSCLSVKSRKPAADRRPSMGDDIQESRALGGKWLLTLSTDLDPFSAAGHHKSIIDAKWALGGKAIIALLSNGEWGIWDIDYANPLSSNLTSTTRSNDNDGTVSNGTFAVSGRIPSFPRSSNKLGSQFPKSSASTEPGPKFAPMTPATRKIREDSFLKGTASRTENGDTASLVTSTNSRSGVRGGIALRRVNIPWDQPWDDSALIWYGDTTVQIGSLLSYWRNAIRPVSSIVPFDSSTRAKAVALEGINFYGQNQLGVSYLPKYSSCPQAGGTTRKDALRGVDILFVADYQLIVLSVQPDVAQEGDLEGGGGGGRISNYNKAEDDMARLRRGELDLEGMDRVLASMSGGAVTATTNSSGGGKLFS